MKIIKLKISGLKLIKTKIYKDKRGFLKEVFKKNIIKKENFIFDLMSKSKKNTLRAHTVKKKTSQINYCYRG